MRHTSGIKDRLDKAANTLRLTYKFGQAMQVDADKLWSTSGLVLMNIWINCRLCQKLMNKQQRMVGNVVFVETKSSKCQFLWDLRVFQGTA